MNCSKKKSADVLNHKSQYQEGKNRRQEKFQFGSCLKDQITYAAIHE